MIISDKYHFVFIHIPKCAGSTVRSLLQGLDDTHGAFTGRVERHPELGLVDYVHIPLFVLKIYFPSEFDKVKRFYSFTVVRDPFSRFPSSFSQHLKRYGKEAVKDLSLKELKFEVTRVINYLSNQPGGQALLPADYIHFQPQYDYIYLQGERVVDRVFGLDKIDALVADLNRFIGSDVIKWQSERIENINQATVYRNELIRQMISPLLPLAQKVVRPLLPLCVHEALRGLVYVHQTQRVADIFDSDYVRSFIKEYYREDIELIQSLTK